MTRTKAILPARSERYLILFAVTSILAVMMFAGVSVAAAPRRAVSAAQREKMFRTAAAALERFCVAYPDSPLAGDAYVKQIDIALERLFDLPLAQKLATRAVAWAKAASNKSAPKKPAAPLPPWALRDAIASKRAASTKRVLYEVYLRAGLVAYLDQRNDDAAKLFAEGDKFDNSARKRAGGETSMARLIKIVRGKMPKLTPDEVLELVKNDNQKTAILLADLYLIAFQPEPAAGIYERLLAGEKPMPKPLAGIEAYLLWRMGQALKFQRKHDEAIVCLKRLYDPKYAKFSWAAGGISRIGTWTFNATDDGVEAMKHWKHVFTNFPKSPDAERSLFFYGLTAKDSKDYKTATRAFEEYLRRYPDSRWSRRVATTLLPQCRKN